MVDMPYFMSNKEWYSYDFGKGKYVLTDKAPEKAKKSYKEFYEELKGSKHALEYNRQKER